MNHLGERVTALVDGQLPTDVAERAARHLVDCPGCRQAVEYERLMKYRLIGLGRPEPRADLLGSLLSMGGPSGPLPPRTGYVPGTPRPALIGIDISPPTRRDSALWSLPRAALPALIPAVRVSRPAVNRVAAAVVGAACLVGTGVAGGVASGGGATAGGAVSRGGAVSNQRASRAAFDTFTTDQADPLGFEPPLTDQTVLWSAATPAAGVPALQTHR